MYADGTILCYGNNGHTLWPKSSTKQHGFQSTYKKASNRVKLMMPLHDHLTPKIVLRMIHMSTIVPITVKQKQRLQSLERRVSV